MLADAVGEAAVAVEAVVAAAVAGDVAAGSRRDFLNCSHHAEERAPDRAPLLARAPAWPHRRPFQYRDDDRWRWRGRGRGPSCPIFFTFLLLPKLPEIAATTRRPSPITHGVQ